MLKKITTDITYKVPAWCYCNLSSNGKATKDKCRFCVKDGKGFRCALYNDLLASEGGALVQKSRACERATAGFKSVVEDIPEQSGPIIDPKTLMKTTIREYDKLRKQLVSQGYPAALAEKAALDYLIGGD